MPRINQQKLSRDDYRAIYQSAESADTLAERYGISRGSVIEIWARRRRGALIATNDLPRRSGEGRYERKERLAIERELNT